MNSRMKGDPRAAVAVFNRLGRRILVCAAMIFAGVVSQAMALTTFTVEVAPGGLFFSPSDLSIQPGDTVMWVWKGSGHSVTSGYPGTPDGLFDSGVHNNGFTFSFTFSNPGTVHYHCTPHGLCCGMTGTVTVAAATPTPSPTPTPDPTVAAQPLNISTRMEVRTGEQVLIGGFIIDGTEPKRMLLRAIGPSLGDFGITNPLPDPLIELHASDQTVITSNDNWKASDQANIEATGLAPSSDLESAILITLDPGNYTAVVSDKNGGTGVGLVEGYDLDQAADSHLANISTRGFVETESNVMIGGFILGGGGANTTVLVRAIGPSLTPFGVAGALPDPTLELRNGDGDPIVTNDNWKESQQSEIEGTNLQPSADLESAVLVTLAPGTYTAIVAGKDGLTGVGLVEVFRIPEPIVRRQ